MGVNKDNRPTKDGKIRFIRLNMKILTVLTKLKNQVDIQLKKEAEDAEFEFKLKLR